MVRYKMTGALLLVAVGMAVLYTSYLRPLVLERSLIKDFERTFFRADPGSIKLIRLDAGEGPVDVVRTSSGWLVAGKYRADEGAVERLLEVIAGGRLLKIVGEASDRDRFGFGRPYATVGIGFEDGRTDVIEIAGQNATGTGHYAYARGLGKVFLVNNEFAREMKLNLYELREKSIVVLNPDDIHRIRIQRENDLLDIVRENNKWIMSSPLTGTCDRDSVTMFLNALYTHRATGFIPWEDQFSKLPRQMTLEIDGRENRSLKRSYVYFWGSERSRGILIREPGSPEAVRTGRDFWTLLDTDASQFLRRALFNMKAGDPEMIKIVLNDTVYLFTKKRDVWEMNGKIISPESMRSILEFLGSWHARKLVNKRAVSGKKLLVVEITNDKEMQRLEIYDHIMNRDVSPTGLAKARSGTAGDIEIVNFWLGSSSMHEYDVVVSSLDLNGIAGLLKDNEE